MPRGKHHSPLIVVMIFAAVIFAAAVEGPQVAQSRVASSPGGDRLPSTLGFKVNGSDGSTMYVLAEPKLQSVEANLEKPGRRFGEATGLYYRVQSEVGHSGFQAEVSDGRIRADFGRHGSINVRFQPTGGTRSYRPFCGGHSLSVPRGFYVGTINVRGDGPVGRVIGSRGAQDMGRMLNNTRCPRKEALAGPTTLGGAELVVNSVRAPENFRAFKNSPKAPAYFDAGISEFTEGMSIIRYASVVSPPASFEYDPGLKAATIHPGPPFHGTGIFAAQKRKLRRWSGDLSVNLPGRPGVRLTRAPLRAFMNPARWQRPHPARRISGG